MNRNAIPLEIREIDQWINWKMIDRGGKSTKGPINPRTGGFAKVNDHQTWASFDEAYAKSDQLGFVFTEEDVYVGIDVDNCVKAGVIHPKTQGLIKRLDSYAEFSPSGTGVHIIVKGAIPDRLDGTQEDRRIEVYSKNRYFTMTGNHIEGTPREIHRNQDALDTIIEKLYKPKRVKHVPTFTSHVDDSVVLDKAMNNTKTGPMFRKLWSGDTSDAKHDHSQADFALCRMLNYWTNSDAAQMDRLFRQSGLMREKWDSYRNDVTYGEKTIQKAIDWSR